MWLRAQSQGAGGEEVWRVSSGQCVGHSEGARWRLGEVAINGMRGRSGQHYYADGGPGKAARGRQLLRRRVTWDRGDGKVAEVTEEAEVGRAPVVAC